MIEFEKEDPDSIFDVLSIREFQMALNLAFFNNFDK